MLYTKISYHSACCNRLHHFLSGCHKRQLSCGVVVLFCLNCSQTVFSLCVAGAWYCMCPLFVYFWLLVPVQLIAWKDLSPKWLSKALFPHAAPMLCLALLATHPVVQHRDSCRCTARCNAWRVEVLSGTIRDTRLAATHHTSHCIAQQQLFLCCAIRCAASVT